MLLCGGFMALVFTLPAVSRSKNVSQTWLDFEQAQKSGGTSIIPDFSYAGYHYGEKAVPKVKAQIFDVTDFGAVANDDKSDREAFIKAIAAATKNNGGIIYFPKGRFHLRDKNDQNQSIVISSSNIVLRGEGVGKNGTELFMEYANPTTDPKKMWGSPSLIHFKASGSKSKITDVVADAKQGSFSVEVATVGGMKVGQWVCLEVRNNDREFIAEELKPYHVEERWTDLTKKGNNIYEYHLITAIEGNTITFKAPLMRGVEKKWGWAIYQFPHLEEVGVENIAFHGNFQEEFVHHKDDIHDGGWSILSMTNLVNSWLTNCTFTNVSNAATIGNSANVSAYNCQILGLTGHAAIKSQGSTRVFLGNIDDQPSQWHSTGVSKPAMGTVIWRVKTSANSCFESHASQPRHTLFDASQGGFMRGRAGGADSNNPNHLGGLLFWNYNQTNEGTDNFDFWATDTKYWRFVMPLFVGFHSKSGKPTNFVEDQVLLNESHGTPVYPESLYEAQLELRLGKIPRWLKDIKKDLYIH